MPLVVGQVVDVRLGDPGAHRRHSAALLHVPLLELLVVGDGYQKDVGLNGVEQKREKINSRGIYDHCFAYRFRLIEL